MRRATQPLNLRLDDTDRPGGYTRETPGIIGENCHARPRPSTGMGTSPLHPHILSTTTKPRFTWDDACSSPISTGPMKKTFSVLQTPFFIKAVHQREEFAHEAAR